MWARDSYQGFEAFYNIVIHQAEAQTVDGSKCYVSGDAYYQQVSNGGKNIYMVVTDPTKSA